MNNIERVGFKTYYHELAELHSQLRSVVLNYNNQLPLASVIGVLEILKLELINGQEPSA